VQKPGMPTSADSCGIWCVPFDCCTNGCCSGIYLFKCTDQCTSEWWYSCSYPCGAFCANTSC
jgi:hypothetical protein